MTHANNRGNTVFLLHGEEKKVVGEEPRGKIKKYPFNC